MGTVGIRDSSVTLVDARPGEKAPATGHPPPRENAPVDPRSPARLDTPLLPASLPCETSARATLTVLTGLQAGHLVTIDGDVATIGRDPDSDLVVDELGVSRRHARIARSPDGGFYVEDLASTNGTFVGSARVGVTLLRQVEVLQLGPSLKLRFAIV